MTTSRLFGIAFTVEERSTRPLRRCLVTELTGVQDMDMYLLLLWTNTNSIRDVLYW